MGTKESGNGPDEIVFGPNPEHSTQMVVVQMSPGTSYYLTRLTVNGRTGVGELRLKGNQLQLEDIKGNNSWDDIVVTPNKGMFTSKNRYTLPLDYSDTSDADNAYCGTITSEQTCLGDCAWSNG